MSYRYSLAPNREWPKTRADRANEYKRRRSAYRGGEYTDDDFKRMFLFQGCNAAGDVIIKTRRISTMPTFLVAVDAACIAGEPTLEIRPGAFPATDSGEPSADAVAALEEGRAFMRRAGVADLIGTWSTAYASEGDLFFEVGTDDVGDWTFYKLEPETVGVWADKYGRTTQRASICFEYVPAGAESAVKYERTITVDSRSIVNGQITTTKGKITTEDGNAPHSEVPNALGVSTVVWVPFDPVPGSYGFSKCAFTDVEDLVAKADSATTQMSAIGTRWADPTLVTKGFSLQDTSTISDNSPGGAPSSAMGKTLPIAKDEEVSYLTVDLTNVESLVTATTADLDAARKGLPEYMFTDTSASSSGLAMSYQSTALVAKLEPRRDRLYGAIARMVGMCRAATANRPWTDAEDIYVVKGPPILPVDRASQAQLLLSLKEAGAITAVDLVAQLQALGFVAAEHDPAEYAATLAAEADALDTRAHALATAISGRADKTQTATAP